MVLGKLAKLLGSAGFGIDSGFSSQRELMPEMTDHSIEQGLLIAVIKIERALGNVGGGGDILHPRAINPFLYKYCCGGFKDGRLTCL